MPTLASAEELERDEESFHWRCNCIRRAMAELQLFCKECGCLLTSSSLSYPHFYFECGRCRRRVRIDFESEKIWHAAIADKIWKIVKENMATVLARRVV